MSSRIPRIGIGGPVGCGKSMLIEKVVPLLAQKNYRVCIISNDVISKEDADRMRKNLSTEQGLLPENLVIGLATGGCPHTAVRDCLLYTSPSPRDGLLSRMPSSA